MEVKEELKNNKFKLPNEKVVVKFIKRKRGLAAHVDDNHVISGGMLTGAKKKYCVPLQRNGSIANVLNSVEKEYLENETGLKLSVYSDFWNNFYVSLYKDESSNTFDLNNPMDYISVKILESLKDTIAPLGRIDLKKGTYDFVITRADEEFKERRAKFGSKKEAWKTYGKIEDDRDKLISILKLLTNQPISSDSKLDWIQGKVEEYLDALPTSFLDIVNDPSFETKSLLNKAIESGYVLRSGNKLSTVDGLELCENGGVPTFDNAVKYLDAPKNQDVKSLMQARIDNAE